MDRESNRTSTTVACYQYASAASTAVIQIVWLLLLVLGLLCPANAMMQIKLKPTGSGAAATGLGEHGLLQSESMERGGAYAKPAVILTGSRTCRQLRNIVCRAHEVSYSSCCLLDWLLLEKLLNWNHTVCQL